MKKSIFGFLLVFVMGFSSTAVAQSFDWANEIKQDLVTISGDTMVFSELDICTVKSSKKTFQIQWNAKAPKKGVISRDHFVTVIATSKTMLASEIAKGMGMSTAQYHKQVKCIPSKEAIGMVDAELTIIMTKGGLQIRALRPATKENTQTTLTWEQVFAD